MKLEIGYHHDFEIRKEFYPSKSGKSFSVLYISDLHLNGYCRQIILKLIAKIEQLNPTIILLGGDYVDTEKGYVLFSELLKCLSTRKNIFAIAGNHDHYLGLERIKEMMIRNKVVWIEKKTIKFSLNNFVIEIAGNQPDQKMSNADFSILCLHKPIDFLPFSEKYNIVFAGHLHGSQFVFWQNKKGLYPGRLFYKWNILKTQTKTCSYFISKGLGDTLPIRYNCEKDIIFVKVLY